MKSNTIVNAVLVIVGFLVAFGLGYLFLGKDEATPVQDSDETTETEVQEEASDVEDLATEIPEEAHALSRNGCLGCHAVESLDARGGDIGPDLSRSMPEMKAKHGKEIDDFLQEPTSAVMSTVLADNPLDDAEREQIIESLKIAAERWNDPAVEDKEEDENEEEAEEEVEED